MTLQSKPISVGVAASMLALTACSVALSETGFQQSDNSNVLQYTASSNACFVNVDSNGFMMDISGVLAASEDMNGTYRFSVKSLSGKNSTNINQGGQFSANAKETIQLGKVMLGTNGSTYKVNVSIDSNRGNFSCDKIIDGHQI